MSNNNKFLIEELMTDELSESELEVSGIEESEELSAEALEAVAGGGGYFIEQKGSWVVIWN